MATWQENKLKLIKHFQAPGWSAAAEVAFTLIVSNMALGLGVFITFLVDRTTEISVSAIWIRLSESINPTEVLVYILAVITPTLWYMAVNARARRYLKGFTWIFLFQCLLIGGSAIVFALSKSGMTLNERILTPFAWGSFLVAVAIWYGVLIFQKSAKEGPHVDATDIVAKGGKAIAQELDA